MKQSHGASGGTANVWRRLAEKLQKEADALYEEAAHLRAEAGHAVEVTDAPKS